MSWYTYAGFADEIDMNVKVQMDAFERIGMRYIELRGVNGKNISEITIEEARKMKKAFDERGFGVSGIGSPIGKTMYSEDNAPEVEKLRHVIRLAQIFETKYIRVFSPFLPLGEDPKKYRDISLARVAAYAEAAKGEDVILVHENEGGFIYGQSPENCLDIVESIGSPYLKVLFDPGNFAYAGYDALHAYELLKPYIEHVHIKDSKGKETVVPAGDGIVQYTEILPRLASHGRHFFLTHEPHLADCAALRAVDDNGFEKMEGEPEALFRMAYEKFDKIVRQGM